MFTRSILAALATSAILSVSANAADIDYRPVLERTVPAARIASAYDWSGLYLGVQGGFGNGTAKAPYAEDIKASGAIFGGLVGYNVQYGKIVFGLESTFNWSGLSKTTSVDWCTVSSCGYSGTDTTKSRLAYFGTTDVRLGFTPWDRVLVYGEGGIAYGKGETTTVTTTSYGYAGLPNIQNSFGMGWNIGAGVDWAVYDKWIVGVKYNHMELNFGGYEYGNVNYDRRFHTDSVLVKAAYKF